MNKTLKITAILICLLMVTATLCSAQTAVYGGRTYTPESFPRATWCPCGMCENIRAQWAASTAKPVAKVQDSLPDENYEYKTVEVEETRYRKRKVCTPVYGPFGRQIGTNCHYVDEPYTVKVKKRVRVAKKNAVPAKLPEQLKHGKNVQNQQEKVNELIPTPLPVVKRLVQLLKPTKSDVLIDAGCGDGRFLIEASSYGCRAIGVEIDSGIVKIARQRIKQSGSSAIVFEGDALKWDYDAASMVVIYQMPDLLADIVKRIPKGVKVASYMHDIPGVKTQKHSIQVDGTERFVYVGVVGGEVKETGATFGL